MIAINVYGFIMYCVQCHLPAHVPFWCRNPQRNADAHWRDTLIAEKSRPRWSPPCEPQHKWRTLHGADLDANTPQPARCNGRYRRPDGRHALVGNIRRNKNEHTAQAHLAHSRTTEKKKPPEKRRPQLCHHAPHVPCTHVRRRRPPLTLLSTWRRCPQAPQPSLQRARELCARTDEASNTDASRALKD